MNVITGTLSVWAGAESACVRIAGRANFAVSVNFRKLLHHLAGTGHRHVLIDLSECASMDSTFIGVLAHEASKLSEVGSGVTRPAIELLNPNATVRQIVEELGIAHLFQFVERDLSREKFEAAPAAGEMNRTELNRTCLEAHELLMVLHPDNVKKFRDVVRFFAEVLRSDRGDGK